MGEEFDFDKFGEEFDAQMIAFEEVAKTITPMFIAFRKQGLTVQEAAAMTAAFIAHTMPQLPQQPRED